MKNMMIKWVGTAAIAATFALNLSAAETHPGQIDFGKIEPAEGAPFVEVNIQSNLIAMAVNLAKQSEPAIADALKGLENVRVNVVGLTDANRDAMKKHISDLRAQLDGSGWDRVVTAIQDKQDVGVFVKMKDAEAVQGVVVTVLNDENQAVLVNIIGDIRPEKLATVGERFDIKPLKDLKLAGASK